MKNFALAALFVLLSFCMNAQVIYWDDENDFKKTTGLKHQKHIADNHITDVKRYAYSHKHPNGALHLEVKYDSRGNMLENIGYDKHGRVNSEFIYQYNDSNRQTSYAWLNKKGKPKWGGFWTYDKSGNVIQNRNWRKDTGNITFSWVMIYNSKQNPTQTKCYTTKKKLYSTTDYEYYDDGSKKKTTTYNQKGKVIAVWNYDCNPIGKLQETKMKDTSKICVHYETDKNGNPIKVKEEYTEGGGLFKYRLRKISKYDKDDHFIELITMKMNGKETWHSCTDFNSQGNITEWRKYKPNSTTIKNRTVYNYNDSGDIIEATIYSKSPTKGSVLKYVYN